MELPTYKVLICSLFLLFATLSTAQSRLDHSCTSEKPCLEGDLVAFVAEMNNESAEPMTYVWDFGTGITDQTSSRQSLFRYGQQGSYIISAIAKNKNGINTTVSTTIETLNAPPEIKKLTYQLQYNYVMNFV